MIPFTIKRLTSGGVITNYNCVSRCGHCLYNCGPERGRAYLDEDWAERIFRRILALGGRSVHIGGGEPLLNPKQLLKVVTAARGVGMQIDYVETNSAWFRGADQADSILSGLLEAGVGTLLVSISPFHNAFIPDDRVIGVIDACRRTGMTVFPWVNGFVRDLTRLDVHKTHGMAEFETAYGSDYLGRIPDRYWIHLGGRALQTFGAVYPRQSLERVLEQSPLSCAQALGDTSHFHIDLYGRYIPGLCAGMSVDMEDLGGALPPAKYPLLERLVTRGIRGFYEWGSAVHGFVPRSDGYLNHCDLCTDIRAYLWQLDGDRFAELAPDGFYA